MRRKIIFTSLALLFVFNITNLFGIFQRSKLGAPDLVEYSPGGRWFIEVYEYPASHFWGGVVRIFDAKTKEIEAEIELSSYCIRESPYRITNNSFLFCSDAGEDGVDLPASFWTRFKAQLP